VAAAVVDVHHVRVLQAGGGRSLAPEALHELLVLREAPVQDLQRHLPPEVGVLGAVDVGHPAGADPVQDPIAPIDEGVVGNLGHRFSRRRTCITCLAIGAATVPPSPCVRSTVTAIATFGLGTGANAMNQAWFEVPFATSAVPVLPATVMPGIWAAVPVPC